MDNIAKSHLTQNEHVYLESEHTHWIYYLVEGTVRTYKIHPTKSNSMTFQIIHKGSFFGYYEVFTEDRKRMSSAAVMSKNAVIEKYRIEDFLIKLIEDEEFYYELFSSCVNYEMHLWKRLLIFREYETFRKIAWMLIDMASSIEHNEEILEIKDYTHLLLGQYTGSSRQTITSVLNEYRKLGLIEYDRDKILIKKTMMQKLLKT